MIYPQGVEEGSRVVERYVRGANVIRIWKSPAMEVEAQQSTRKFVFYVIELPGKDNTVCTSLNSARRYVAMHYPSYRLQKPGEKKGRNIKIRR